jgi:hypothetical protein
VVPFLSEFRRPFYQRLEEDLDARGMSLTIAYGAPYSEDQVARRDVIDIDGAVRVRQACLWLAGRPLVHKRTNRSAISSSTRCFSGNRRASGPRSRCGTTAGRTPGHSPVSNNR